MKLDEGYFKGQYGKKLFYKRWMPDGESKAVVFVVHGILEHTGRYENVVNALVPNGIQVIGFDLPGHGKSEGHRMYVKNLDEFLQDVEVFLNHFKEDVSNLNKFLLGHSLGAVIVLNYLGDSKFSAYKGFKGVILSGFGPKTGPDVKGITKFLARIFSVILPKIHIPSGADANGLSRDPEVVKAYVEDPYVFNMKVTPRLANVSIKGTSTAKDAALKIDPTLPILFQYGSDDLIFDQESRKPFFDSLPTKDKEIKIYENYRHEIYNEINKEIPLNDLKEWILKHNK